MRWKANMKTKCRTWALLLIACPLALGTFLADESFAQGSADDFVITVKPGIDRQFTIPTYPGLSYNYDVDMDNDGTIDKTGATGDYTCIFPPGSPALREYTIRIHPGPNGTGFPRIYFNNADEGKKLISINQWGASKWTSMANAFAGSSLKKIDADDAPDLSNLTDLSGMFSNCSHLPNLGNETWDTSNVTNMKMMFSRCPIFDGDIGNWNTLNVTNMSYMFIGARVFNQNIGNWNTSNVTTMASMFYDAMRFNQDISHKQITESWNTSNVVDMSQMFRRARSFNQDIGNWNTSNVRGMYRMFSGTPFDQDIGSWNVEKLEIADLRANLSIANYDALLRGWGSQTLQTQSYPNPQIWAPINGYYTPRVGDHKVKLKVNSAYCMEAAARDHIMSTYRWVIEDEGCKCLGIEITFSNFVPNSKIIPASGGDIRFRGTGRNRNRSPVTGDIWGVVIDVNGTTISTTPFLPGVTIAANSSEHRDHSETVPAALPAGTYTFTAYFGDYANQFIVSSESFTFTKQ